MDSSAIGVTLIFGLKTADFDKAYEHQTYSLNRRIWKCVTWFGELQQLGWTSGVLLYIVKTKMHGNKK